ncbi:hypothetical protein BDQ12DRAFT_654772, partial [Crucibulum laeve]
MLVVHPSSCCDICLDPYSWETPECTPHAIPCGHIFCRRCLSHVDPPTCPLCRKAYTSERFKKLHVDRPDEVVDPTEVTLLQKFVLKWDGPEDELAEVTSEVNSWLSDTADDTPLKKARDVLSRYQRIRTKLEQERRKFQQQERTSRALEEQLELAKAREVEITSYWEQQLVGIHSFLEVNVLIILFRFPTTKLASPSCKPRYLQ